MQIYSLAHHKMTSAAHSDTQRTLSAVFSVIRRDINRVRSHSMSPRCLDIVYVDSIGLNPTKHYVTSLLSLYYKSELTRPVNDRKRLKFYWLLT